MNILAESIEYLWYSMYGMIAGWGLTTTFFAILAVMAGLKILRLERRLNSLENRLIHAERDYNITLVQWKKKS